jgi:nucleoporin POM152
LPTVDVSLDPITDSCAGEVGLRAIFSLSGEPPYRLTYSVQHGSSRPLRKTRTIRLSREEIEFKPEQTGEFTYRFESLDDKNYESIRIDREVRQVVHPLAGVRFEQAGKGEHKVWSCESQGDAVAIPIELKGIAPWRVDYKIVGQKEVYTAESISETKHSLDVKIPPKIAKSGGSFTLSIGRSRENTVYRCSARASEADGSPFRHPPQSKLSMAGGASSP